MESEHPLYSGDTEDPYFWTADEYRHREGLEPLPCRSEPLRSHPFAYKVGQGIGLALLVVCAVVAIAGLWLAVAGAWWLLSHLFGTCPR